MWNYMDWKYFIPHIWEREREIWEDVYLLPVDSHYDGAALWLTIDALGNVDIPEHAEALQRLGDRSFYIDGSDMLIRAEDFTKQELLAWVRIWLQENELSVTNLIEGLKEEFRGRAFHADLLTPLQKNESEETG